MQPTLKNHLIISLKGMGMGAANVIPGVSGGTVALITRIFERIINAIKSFDTKAINLLFRGRFKELIEYVDFYFLIALGSGMVISIISLARILKYLFVSHPIFIWAFFFGLILASVYYIGKTIGRWSLSVCLTFVIGAAVAGLISFMNPATPNESFFYLVLCGVIAICSMILPGLSGSFVLIIMGNYELVMIDAVNKGDVSVLGPVILGGIVGVISLSHLLSWVYRKYKDQTVSLLTGFILGSLSILWPWKSEIYRVDDLGNYILKDGEKIVQSYELFLPSSFNWEVAIAIFLSITGFVVIAFMERIARGAKEI